MLAAIRRRLGGARRCASFRPKSKEPRGVAALAELAAARCRTLHHEGSDGRRRSQQLTAVHGRPWRSARASARHVAPESLDAIRGASLLFFGGKGGVGKTTVAAATALRLARADPTRRVLLLSTDPAHSLGDVLDAPVERRARPSSGAVRRTCACASSTRRARSRHGAPQLEAALDEIASAIGQGAPRYGADRAAELMDLAPPGIDELFGILSVVDARADYDAIVVDTAPTGHALRLLEMPDAAREWVQVLLRVLLKYRDAGASGSAGRGARRRCRSRSASCRRCCATRRRRGSSS